MQPRQTKTIFRHLWRSALHANSFSGLVGYFGLSQELQDQLQVCRMWHATSDDYSDASIESGISLHDSMRTFYEALPD